MLRCQRPLSMQGSNRVSHNNWSSGVTNSSPPPTQTDIGTINNSLVTWPTIECVTFKKLYLFHTKTNKINRSEFKNRSSVSLNWTIFFNLRAALAILNFEQRIIFLFYFFKKTAFISPSSQRVPYSGIALHVISLQRPVLVRRIRFGRTYPQTYRGLDARRPIFYGIRCESGRSRYLVSRDRSSWYRR